MKVSVAASVVYYFDVEVPDDEDDVACYIDTVDEAYGDMVKILMKAGYEFEGNIDSIIDPDGKIIYMR